MWKIRYFRSLRYDKVLWIASQILATGGSHDHDIFEAADRITVLRLGRNAALLERSAVTQQEVVHAITAGVPTKVAGVSQTTDEEEQA